MVNYLLVINLGRTRVPMIAAVDDRSNPENSRKYTAPLRRLRER
jgi:hypothetical protein